MTVKNTKNITKIEIWCNILTKRIVDINNIKLYNGLLPVVKIISYETGIIWSYRGSRRGILFYQFPDADNLTWNLGAHG